MMISHNVNFTLMVFLLQFLTGLIKLPRKVVSNSYVQPIQLPTECDDDLDNISVVAIGIGLSTFSGDYDLLLRQAYFRTMSFVDCGKLVAAKEKPDSILCVETVSGQSTYHGDSGMNN